MRLEQKRQFPTVLFTNVTNLLREPGHSVVMNLTALRENLAVACGLDRSQYKMDLTKKLLALYDQPHQPVIIPKADAPVKSKVFTENADLRKLPVLTTHEADGGPYLTMMAVTKHPEWSPIAPGVHNVAFNRMQYREAKKTNILIGVTHNNSVFQDVREERYSLPCRCCSGHHPLFLVGACTPTGGRHERV